MEAVNPQPLQALPYEDHLVFPTEDDGDDYDDGGDGDDGMDEAEDEHVTSVNASDHHHHYYGGGGGVVVASRTSELTLAFEGEVYVFPAVTPEKVQAVLLLLGERKIPTGVTTIDVPFNSNNRVILKWEALKATILCFLNLYSYFICNIFRVWMITRSAQIFHEELPPWLGSVKNGRRDALIRKLGTPCEKRLLIGKRWLRLMF
ncbi:hypothetical protein CsSME_00035609 [Camellia sinensis var. sinensis]